MENTLEKADGQLENLEKMVADMEFAQIEMDVVEGLKIGNESLKQLHALMSIDNIEALLDETREGVEKQRVLIVVRVSKCFILTLLLHRKLTSFWEDHFQSRTKLTC